MERLDPLANSTFENNSQGKFMLAITFGYSKYYVDNLSENVRRGNRTKVENGWKPGRAPLGYRNDRETRTMVPDPDRFELVRQMWQLMLTGAYTPHDIWHLATKRWGLCAMRRGRSTGAPIAKNVIYRMFGSPFYAGIIEYAGRSYPGKHRTVVTIDEFERVRNMLRRPIQCRRQRHEFAYTGLIRCGECGFAITAEHQTNRFGSKYVYYHCSKQKRDYECRQPYVSLRSLEQQIVDFLEGVSLPDRLHRWAVDRGRLSVAARAAEAEEQRRSAQAHLMSVENQLVNLTKLRVRDLLTDDEYLKQRQELEQERQRLAEMLARAAGTDPRFEPVELVSSFSNKAVFRFRSGNLRTKRLILSSVGSNLTLRDKKLSIQAVK
ncbi:MAG: zinc ribbon domain-containing protein, partial [Patescibacteria group bacterium]